MIIFGISESFRDGKPIACRCETCGRSAQTTVKYFRYFHLFWLPIVPLGAGQGLVCEHCQRVQLGRRLGETKQRVKEANRDVRRPIWHFIGTALLAGMIGYNAVAAERLEEMAHAEAAEPEIGEVWIVDMVQALPEADAPYRYGNAKVVSVDDEGAELAFSDWTFGFPGTARREARAAMREGKEDYFTTGIWFSNAQLIELSRQDDLRLVKVQ